MTLRLRHSFHNRLLPNRHLQAIRFQQSLFDLRYHMHSAPINEVRRSVVSRFFDLVLRLTISGSFFCTRDMGKPDQYAVLPSGTERHIEE
jgi:hypothetical protein